MKFKIAISLTIYWFPVQCTMHTFVVALLAIQSIIEMAYGLQHTNEDINHIINYLLKQNRKEIVNNNNAFHTHNNFYHNKDYDVENSDAEIIQPGLEILSNLLNNKKTPPRDLKDSEYSKVYLVLDPQANINTADFKRIGEIVSSLISDKGRLKTKPPTKIQPRRYKGFVLMDDVFARRRNKESKELYPIGSIERDYKAKRARNDYSAAGRTSIPYIGHRGDIYEKE